MANFKIQYDPNSNVISAVENCSYCGDVFIFYYEILRCEAFAEVRIWCDLCDSKECIYTCSPDRTDAEIIEEVNKNLDNVIDCYVYEMFRNTDDDMPDYRYCDCMYYDGYYDERRYQRGL